VTQYKLQPVTEMSSTVINTLLLHSNP